MQKSFALKFAAVITALTFAFAGSPALAASLKPTITTMSNTKPAAAGGTPITVTGTNLGTVTSITVDNSYATVSKKSSKSLTFLAPQHALGVAKVLITNPAGTATFNINYSPQRRPLVPSPTLPVSIKLNASYTVTAQDPTWVVTLTTDTPKTCSTSGATVKGIAKGSCVLNIDINPDPATGSNPSWRGKVIVDSLLIN